jgi:Nucleotidyl transferase AbiEii toxin, Type IV TA system
MQRYLWPRLSAIGTDFVLYGGTALSLQLGGRISVDFDFFTENPVHSDHLVERLPFLKGARLRQRAADTATFAVEGTNGEVSVSFFGKLRFGRVSEPVRFSDNGIYAAGLLDIAALKVSVIQQRAEAKDYMDIHTLLSNGVTLELALGAAQALYPEFNPTISLKALSYFGDIAHLSPEIQRDLRIASSNVREIPEVARQSNSLFPSLGSIARTPEIDLTFLESREIKPKEPELEI